MSAPARASVGPVTATGTASHNIDGQAIAITVFSTIKWWGRLFLPILFFVTKRLPRLTTTIVKLSFIHFARWSIIKRIPYNGAPQSERTLRHPHMYFESNFNGGWEEYIDAFSHILTSGMAAFWGSSYGFPKALPTAPFKTYIQNNETAASHYYCAYPDATITMIKAALDVDAKLAPLKRNAAKLEPKAFAAAYERFLPALRSRRNVNGQAYGFQAMTPIVPGQEHELRAYLETMHAKGSPLAKLPRTHMARFVIVEDFFTDPAWKQRGVDHLDLHYLIFTSNLDGDIDSYLDELCEILAPEAREIWGRCVGCPGSAKGAALKTYLKHNQIDCGFFYAAYGASTVREVKGALAQREQMIAFATSTQGVGPEELQRAFVAEFGSE